MEPGEGIESIVGLIEMLGGGLNFKHKLIFFSKKSTFAGLDKMALSQKRWHRMFYKLVNRLYGTWERHRVHHWLD